MKSRIAQLLVPIVVAFALLQPSPAGAFSLLELFGLNRIAIPYRLTIVYEKDGVEYRGSGVISAEYSSGGVSLPNLPSVTYRWRGEALGIDIPGIGRVFALVIRPRQETPSIISDACDLGSLYDLGADEWFRRLRDEFRGICPVPRDALPFFAIFENPSDPTSVQVLTADTLPKGLVVKSATIERTGDQPTYGTTDILTWLDAPMFPPLGSVSGEFLQDGKWKKSSHAIVFAFRDGAS